MNQFEKNIIHKDGVKTELYCFQENPSPLASILILHGMAEHHTRYYPFIEHLVKEGFDVYIYNHRGHGSNRPAEELGYISPRNGHLLLIQDGIDILKYIRKNGRCNKLYLFGHSMGSLVSRCIIQSYHDLNGVILTGSTLPAKLKIYSGLLLTSLIKAIYGPTHPSKLMNKLLFGAKPYKMTNTRTPFDWLTCNKEVVDAYISDPYCGFLCSISFYKDLLNLSYQSGSPKRMKMTAKDLPIYILSGEKDPVGNMGKEIKHLYDRYLKWNYKDITMKLYPNCRHELLQELNSKEVMEDISSWLKSHC